MGNLNVAVLGAVGYAGEIGKKGTVTDVTFFNLKQGDDSVTLIEATKYPEKLSSLFYSTAMSEFVILVVDKIDSNLGETILMADAFGLSRGWIVLRNYIQEEQIKPLIADTSLESFTFVADDPIKLRGDILAEAAKLVHKVDGESCGSIPVDSHFNVKGVGTVVLGSVIDGFVKKHDKLRIVPLEETVVLKSIQKHDIDSDFGAKGDHVGIALRGIESERLDRGYVLTTDNSVKISRSVKSQARLVKYWPAPIKDGMVMHIGHWMQMIPCRIMKVDNGNDFKTATVELELDSDMIHKPGDTAVMMYLEGGKLRIVGSTILQ